jgi:hypothetical protein
VTGPDVDWNRIVAEAMQVLRENPSMFDITQAYDYTAMNQDDTTGNDMTDMERQIREDESDTETDGDVPGLEEVPEDGDLPVLLPRNRINSSDSEVSVTKTMMMKAPIAESPNWCHDLVLLCEGLILLWKSFGVSDVISNVR